MINSRRYVSAFATSNKIKSLLQHMMVFNKTLPFQKKIYSELLTENKKTKEILVHYVMTNMIGG